MSDRNDLDLEAGEVPSEIWSQTTKDYWFFAFLALSTVSVAYLFSPYTMVLLFAGVTVVVTWPIYQWILERVRGNKLVGALLTVVVLALAIFGPTGTVLYIAAVQAVDVGQGAVEWVQSGGAETMARGWVDSGEAWIRANPTVAETIDQALPEDFDLVASIIGPVRDGTVAFLNAAGGFVPQLIGSAVTQGINAIIFLFTVVTLYMEGPRVLDVAKNLSPMEDAYELRLFNVFREFANNMVLGSLATAALQGVVAAIGYLIVGAEGVIFLSLVTAVTSFVPMIGTLVVWGPVSIAVGVEHGWAWAAFLVVWNLLFTGSVDNVVKPLFLRGSSDIHPLLIFLAVFGGLQWFSLPGVLIGPVLVAFFLALYTIFKEDYLRIPPKEVEHEPSWIDTLTSWWQARQPAPAAAAAGEALAPEAPPPAEPDKPSDPDPIDLDG